MQKDIKKLYSWAMQGHVQDTERSFDPWEVIVLIL